MYQPVLKLKPNGAPVISGQELDVLGERLVTDFLKTPLIDPQEIDIDRFVTRYRRYGFSPPGSSAVSAALTTAQRSGIPIRPNTAGSFTAAIRSTAVTSPAPHRM